MLTTAYRGPSVVGHWAPPSARPAPMTAAIARSYDSVRPMAATPCQSRFDRARTMPAMDTATVERLFRWLLIILIVAGTFFGIAPFVAPAQFASAAGFAGTDVFAYRIAGAATFGYAVGLAAGFRAGWTSLRIPIASTAVFNAASVAACLVAISSGRASAVVYLILAASVVFTVGTAYFLARPPVWSNGPSRTASGRNGELAPWVTGLFAIGSVAAALFGLAALIGAGAFGRAVGASGADDFIYRQSGAATLGAAVGGLLVVQSRRWDAARLPAIMAIVFNGLSVIAAALDVGGGRPISYVILGAAAAVTVGMLLALIRG